MMIEAQDKHIEFSLSWQVFVIGEIVIVSFEWTYGNIVIYSLVSVDWTCAKNI